MKFLLVVFLFVGASCTTSEHYPADPSGRTQYFWECQDRPRHATRFDPDGDSVFVDWEFRLFERLGICKDWKSYPGNRGESYDGK